MNEWNEVIRSHIDKVFSLVVYGLSGTDRSLKVSIENRITRDAILNIEDFAKSMYDTRSVKLLAGPQFNSFPEFHIVEFLPEALEDPREIFGILHEIGHVEEYAQNGWHRKFQSEQDFLSDDLRAISEISDLKIERIVWANAICYARLIKSDFGVDLFKLFHNVYEFMGWIRKTGLRSYERSLERQGIRAYTKNREVKLWLQREIEEMGKGKGV